MRGQIVPTIVCESKDHKVHNSLLTSLFRRWTFNCHCPIYIVPPFLLNEKQHKLSHWWYFITKQMCFGSYDGVVQKKKRKLWWSSSSKTKTKILRLISHIFLETFTSKILGFEFYRKQIMKINWWNAYKKFLIWYNGYRQNIDLTKRFKLLKSNVNTHKIYRIIIYKTVF